MKRNRKVKKPVEQSTDGSDTEEVTTAQAVKKKVVTRKTRNSKPEKSSDSEDASKLKLPMKNEKEKQKKSIESSDCIQVAGTSHNSDSEDIPSILPKRKVRVKKANVPILGDNSDTTVSLLPENLSQIDKKRIATRASSTTGPSDDSDLSEDSETKPQKDKKKGKKVLKKEKATSNDSGTSEIPTEKDGMSININQPQLSESKWLDSSNNSDSEVNPQILKKKGKKVIKPEDASSNDSDESEQDDAAIKHRQDLDDLSRVDPEFYNFLQEHDSKLLNFNDTELGDSDEDDRSSEQEDQVHVPSELHGGSDESDFEEEDKKPVGGNVTLKMVCQLEIELQNSKIKLSTITTAVKLFNAAVLRATSDDGTTQGEFKVTGSSVFNAVLNMCVLYMPNAIAKYLGFTEVSGKDPQNCKHFVKIKSTLIEYLSDLLKLLHAVSSDNILTTMLKHLHQLCKYVACFVRISKNAIKKLLPLWSAAEETVRVLSFMCILRITRNHQQSLLIPVLKAMFLTYMKNCKFVSPTTWPGINFMRRSLAEMFTLDLNASYMHVFLYVRQLGIHLRNAIVVPRKDHKLLVFNWQYMNALHLWAELVSQNIKHSGMKSLNFPLVMIISNCIKLGSTQEYYPMRFYLIEILMKMEEASGEFITIMPFFMDIINKFDINKKHKKASMKPLDFSCIIRLSRSQMGESGFKDAVVERFYALLLEYTASLSYKMIYPDCCMVLILFFRELVDKCNNSNHKKKFKQLLDKIVENNEYITKKRLTFDGHLAELATIVAWEKQIKAHGTPLLTYFENWKKLNKIQKRKAITKNDELAGILPLIKRPKVEVDRQDEQDSKTSGPLNLFPSDSEDDDFFKENNEETTSKKKVTKSKGKKEKITIKKEVTKRQKKMTAKKVSKASNSNELEVADTGDVVSEFSW